MRDRATAGDEEATVVGRVLQSTASIASGTSSQPRASCAKATGKIASIVPSARKIARVETMPERPQGGFTHCRRPPRNQDPNTYSLSLPMHPSRQAAGERRGQQSTTATNGRTPAQPNEAGCRRAPRKANLIGDCCFNVASLATTNLWDRKDHLHSPSRHRTSKPHTHREQTSETQDPPPRQQEKRKVTHAPTQSTTHANKIEKQVPKNFAGPNQNVPPDPRCGIINTNDNL